MERPWHKFSQPFSWHGTSLCQVLDAQQKRKFLVGISTSVLWPKVKLTYLINIPIVRGLCVLPVYIFADVPVLVERYSSLVLLMVASNIISLPIQARVYSHIPNVEE